MQTEHSLKFQIAINTLPMHVSSARLLRGRTEGVEDRQKWPENWGKSFDVEMPDVPLKIAMITEAMAETTELSPLTIAERILPLARQLGNI
jgi:hypothetical protein